jgi:hypothetical protein
MRRHLVAILLLILPLLMSAPGPAIGQPVLPLPLSPGGSCSFLVPCARSDDLAAHLRGGLLILDAPDQTRPAVHFGISASLWHWAEVGAAWFASFGNSEAGIDTWHGPVTLWGRFSTPRGLFSRDKAEGLFLAAQLQYDSTHDPFDQGGRLLADQRQLFLPIGDNYFCRSTPG